MSGELSPTMAHLRTSYEALREELAKAERENELANEREAKHKTQYEFEYATAFLRAEGSVKERECLAKVATIELYGALNQAVALRRSSRAAIDSRMKQLDAVTSQGHAYNRELKVLDG